MYLDLFEKDKSIAVKYKELKEKYPNNITGNIKHSGNCILVVMTKANDKGVFEEKYEWIIKKILRDNNLKNVVVTYALPDPTTKVTRPNLKSAESYLSKVMDIFYPKLIVAIGDDTLIPLIGVKPLMDINHGKKVGTYLGIDVFATFPGSYYLTKEKAFETNEYKQAISDNDWNIITQEYNRRINANI